MRRTRWPVGALLLASFLIGSIGAAAAASIPSHASSSSRPGADVSLTVSVGNVWTFSLSTDEVQPGDQVTVTLVELGDTAHTFTLSPIPNFVFNSSDGTSHLNDFFAAHQPLVNLTVDGTVTGQRVSGTFTAPAYGLYEYVCLESGHFANGMSGQLGSGEHGSTTTVDTGPGWPVFAIGGGIAGLVVATIVLAFIIGQRPGSKHEMPPERLGYPETPSSGPTPPSEH